MTAKNLETPIVEISFMLKGAFAIKLQAHGKSLEVTWNDQLNSKT